jgi:hypothetical protein
MAHWSSLARHSARVDYRTHRDAMRFAFVNEYGNGKKQWIWHLAVHHSVFCRRA